jgi:SWIM zinc finger
VSDTVQAPVLVPGLAQLPSQVLAQLRAFDRGVLETLASKGLVRRAENDVVSGKVVLARSEVDCVAVSADGETVEIGSGGPKAARCTCPAQGFCRHRIAAVLFLAGLAPATADTPGAPDTAAAQPVADPLAEMLALTPQAIAKWAGAAGLREAHRLAAAAGPVAVERDGTSLIVRLGADRGEVRYLAGQGLDGMLSKASPAQRKAVHAAALIAVRRAHGLDVPEVASAAPAGPEVDAEFLAQVEKALADGARSALAQAPEALEERIAALAVSSRAGAMPRLAGLLRGLAAGVRRKRERDFALDPAALLSHLAQAYALVGALRRARPSDAGDGSLARLKGAARQGYDTTLDLDLIGLGATVWRAGSGARGLTSHFFAPALARLFTLTLARDSHRDTQFDPIEAYERERLFGAAPMALLCRSRVLLAQARTSPEGRISIAQQTSARLESWQPARAACADWPIAFADWAALAAALADRASPALSAEGLGRAPVLLMPSRHAPVTFDELAQEHVWPVCDGAGRWTALTLPHDAADPMPAARLARYAAQSTIVLIMAIPGLDRRGFTLTPFALVAETLTAKDPVLASLKLDAPGTAPMSRDTLDWWRMRRPASDDSSQCVAAVLARASWAGTTVQALDEAREALVGVAELGFLKGSGELKRLAELSRRLERYELRAVAETLTRLVGGEPAEQPAHFLRATHVVERAQALTRTLPWLHPC